MVTFVGTQENFSDAIKELVELDYAAIEAYQAAIDRLENEGYKKKLGAFQEQHERHTRELSDLLKKHNHEVPESAPMGKQLLTKGKVILANLVGDEAILRAMRSNEIDTNVAYERVNARDDIWPDAQIILKRGLQEEKAHKAWLEETIESK